MSSTKTPTPSVTGNRFIRRKEAAKKLGISIAMLALMSSAVWEAEHRLGYDHTLAGEVNGDCWEDSRVEYWLPKLEAFTKSAVSLNEQVALALALHRGEWYLKRVKRYGAEELNSENSSWALDW